MASSSIYNLTNPRVNSNLNPHSTVVGSRFASFSCAHWRTVWRFLRTTKPQQQLHNTWSKSAGGIFTFPPLCAPSFIKAKAKPFGESQPIFYQADVRKGKKRRGQRRNLCLIIPHVPGKVWDLAKPVISASHNFTQVSMKDQLSV